MSTELIIIRHGYSEANKTKTFAGQADFALTDTGIKQANLCGGAFKNKDIDKIYASDLKRAYDTALPIAKALKKEIIKDKALREIDAGFWAGMPFDKIKKKYPEEYKIWNEDTGKIKCPGGESIEELYSRIVLGIKEIAKKCPGEKVLIVTHATPIRVIMAAARGIPPKDIIKVPWVRNASISYFKYDKGSLSEISVDNTDHLGADAIETVLC